MHIDTKYQKNIGRIGEDIATNYLISQGYKVLAKNFTIKAGEIDIIAEKDNSIRFIEVKTRTNESFSQIEDTITDSKTNSLKYAAKMYIVKSGKNIFDVDFGFDFVGILLIPKSQKVQKISYIKDFITWMS